MADSPTRAAFAPVVCPKCGQVKGQPYDVFMAGRIVPVTVYLECEGCHHRWSVDGSSADSSTARQTLLGVGSSPL